MKMWCSWVTSATCRRSIGNGILASATSPTITVPLRRRVDAGEQSSDGRLAGARGPDDGESFARSNGQRDAVQARRSPVR